MSEEKVAPLGYEPVLQFLPSVRYKSGNDMVHRHRILTRLMIPGIVDFARFKTKAKAKQTEAKKRDEVMNPRPTIERRTDICFLTLINLRLDFLKEYPWA
ncbi:MAG: hypothetical protein ACMUJM_03410 [bacterium]